MNAILCDLDGVLYRGSDPIPGVSVSLERLLSSVDSVYFITNNSTRTPQATADKITRMTGIDVGGEQVLTSSQAAIGLLVDSDVPVLVVGEEGLRESVAAAGHEMTVEPNLARSVVVGLTRSLSYETISDAMQAILNGARFVATNDDTTFPTENGLAPGCGAIVAAIAAASGARPEVAGKPNPPMRDLIRSKIDGRAWVIGDRVNTDIAMAAAEPQWRSILVLTGVTDPIAAAAAPADHVVEDFPAAVDLVLKQLVHPS